MNKLNKPPARSHIIYDAPGGFYRNNEFIFSDQLPYLKKRNREKVEDSKKRRKEK